MSALNSYTLTWRHINTTTTLCMVRNYALRMMEHTLTIH